MEYYMQFLTSKLSNLLAVGIISSALCLSPLAQANPMTSDKDKLAKGEKMVKDKSKATKNKKLKKAKSKPNSKSKVNINTASEAELLMLKGIGKKKAQAIISYRKKNGKFKSTDDLLNVNGIGEKLVAKNNKHISFSGKSVLPTADKAKKSRNKMKEKAKSTKKIAVDSKK